MDDGCVLSVSVLHAVSVLVAYAFNTEGTATGNPDVEDKVIPVGWGRRDGETGIVGTWENRGTTMEARNGVEDGLVVDGDLESGDMNLLRAKELLHFVGDNRGLIAGEKFGRRVFVEDGVVEGLDGEP